ncbi:MAG: hypothetical protein ACLQO7_03935 [Candidatus Bathyarchaeia archaeon]
MKVSVHLSAVLVTVVALLATVLAGTVTYHNSVLENKNSKIASLNTKISNLASQVTNLTAKTSQIRNLTSANLVTAIGVAEVVNTSRVSRAYNRLYIEGSVTNNGSGFAFNVGLRVLACAADGTLEINMTVPLTYGEFGTNAAIYSYIYSFDPYCTSSPQFGNLSSGQSAEVNLDIYHDGTVTNWTITPVWTNTK